MEHDANGLRILARDECLRLLEPGGFGRVGLSHRALPVILPVGFGLLDDDVVFPVPDGGFLQRAASRNDVVCFEADSADLDTGEAWSVVVTGQLLRAEGRKTLERASQLGIRGWLTGEPGEYLRLPATIITGRHTSLEPSAEEGDGTQIGGQRAGHPSTSSGTFASAAGGWIRRTIHPWTTTR